MLAVEDQDNVEQEGPDIVEKIMASPRPWEVDDDKQRMDGIGTVHMHRVVDATGRVVVEFSNTGCSEIVFEDDGEGGGKHYDRQAMVNAELIAAAPDLYAALDFVLDAYVSERDWHGASQYDVDNDRVVVVAKAAMAKARGEST